jgi:hypothetical protein
MIAEMNKVFEGSDIQFWLQSHDVFCTETVAWWDDTWDTVPDERLHTYEWDAVKADIEMVFPHAGERYDFDGEMLHRRAWLHKGFILYGDPHGLTFFVHSDFETAVRDHHQRLPYEVLPQHGYYPWYTPGVVYMFLSAIVPQHGHWEFDEELTPAHEIGHALGNCHTHDFDGFCLDAGTFPGGEPYTWADHWDLITAYTGSGHLGFSSRAEAEKWLADFPALQPVRIDRFGEVPANITLDAGSGRMTATVSGTNTLHTYYSESMVSSPESCQVRLLQGLSFDLDHVDDDVSPGHLYSWQRNIMSYDYPSSKGGPRARIDPYHQLTARFSQSQIEVMQRQLQGSTEFTNYDETGMPPPGTESLFASRFDMLGNGETDDFVWYSNGEGPADVDPSDAIEDRIAFRSAPAGIIGLLSGEKLVSGDLNGDDLTDLLWYRDDQLVRILWSSVENTATISNVHHFDVEILPANPSGDFSAVFTGDFDANGADDLVIVRSSESTAYLIGTIYHFRQDPTCHSIATCQMGTRSFMLDSLSGPVAVGNFDSANGDDIVWGTYANGRTTAHVVWSNPDGSLSRATAYEVGNAEYVPYAGNFNGTGGDDVLWHTWKGQKNIFWWGAESASLVGAFSCGPGGSVTCADRDWGPISSFHRLTIGDFDGNGADDILVQETHDPDLYFSANDGSFVYTGHNRQVKVALRNSNHYIMTVGEFDGMVDHLGRLGDDIYLYHRPWEATVSQ